MPLAPLLDLASKNETHSCCLFRDCWAAPLGYSFDSEGCLLLTVWFLLVSMFLVCSILFCLPFRALLASVGTARGRLSFARPAGVEALGAEEIKARLGPACCWLRFRQRGSVWGPSRTAPSHVFYSGPSSQILTALPVPRGAPGPGDQENTSQSVTRAVQHCTQAGAVLAQ